MFWIRTEHICTKRHAHAKRHRFETAERERISLTIFLFVNRPGGRLPSPIYLFTKQEKNQKAGGQTTLTTSTP